MRFHRTCMLVCALAAFSGASRSEALTFTVTKTADTFDGVCDTDCSLRDATYAALSGGGGDTVVVPAGTYPLNTPGTYPSPDNHLYVGNGVALSGAGSDLTILDGGGTCKGLTAPYGGFELSGMTVRNFGGTGFAAVGSVDGMSLSLSDVVVTGNSGFGVSSNSPCYIMSSKITLNGGVGVQCAGNFLTGTEVSFNGKTGVVSGYDILGQLLASEVVDSLIEGNEEGGGVFLSDLTMSNSTVRNNRNSGTYWSGGAGGLSVPQLSMTDSLISGNRYDGVCETTGYGGGGLYVLGVGNTISRSTIQENYTTCLGGGIFNDGPLFVVNSTVANNTAEISSGGIYGTVTVSNSTIVGNNAPLGGALTGRPGTTTIRNSIFSENQPAACSVTGGGTLVSQGHNLDDDGSCGLSATGDISAAADPRIAPIGYYGGSTPTAPPCRALGVPHPACIGASPAIDAGDPAVPGSGAPACEATDQRSVPRPEGSSCDIGAVEETCGNGTMDAGEECDDGNATNGDACDANCTVPGPGNGIQDPGEACDDGNTDDGDCCSSTSQMPSGCMTAPISTFKIIDEPDDSRDRLLWKGVHLDTSVTDFGDPRTSTGYQLCVWDGSNLTLRTRIDAGGTCGHRDCWKRVGSASQPKGFSYVKTDVNLSGVFKALLKAGSGNGRVLVKGKEGRLGLPGPSSGSAYFDSTVTVQLIPSDSSSCWQSTYATSRENSPTRFRARTP